MDRYGPSKSHWLGYFEDMEAGAICWCRGGAGVDRDPRRAVLARCVSHSVIHVTYGSKPQIGKTSVAHTAAQTEPGEHRGPF